MTRRRAFMLIELPVARERGFTLIELLVVVAIIATLLAILMPSMGRAIEASHRATCASQQRQLSVAMLGTGVDNNGLLLDSMGAQYSNVAQAWGEDAVFELLENYLDNQIDVFFCPGFMARNTRYYTTTRGFFEFSNSWRSWMPNRRATSYFCGTARILDSATNPYSNFTYPNGDQRAHRISAARPDAMLFADVTQDVNNDFYVGGFVGFSSPPHPGADGVPEGGNVAALDGSAVWKSFDDMILRYSYVASDPSGLRQYWW